MLTIALQFHPGDAEAAFRLARLIADIEPARNPDVLFLFVRRHDAAMDMQTRAHVAQKFAVDEIVSLDPATGWPAGPNAMAKALFTYARQALAHHEFVLAIEPDCTPLSREWIAALRIEWYDSGHSIVGTWRNSGGAHGHINGNGMFIPSLLNLMPPGSMVFTPHLAWDCAIAPYVHKRWQHTELIRNLFQTPTITRSDIEAMRREGVALLHGIKDDSAHRIAREVLL
jgi:hypothetical protein